MINILSILKTLRSLDIVVDSIITNIQSTITLLFCEPYVQELFVDSLKPPATTLKFLHEDQKESFYKYS